MNDVPRVEEVVIVIIILPIIVLLLFFIHFIEVADGQADQNQNASVSKSNHCQTVPWIGVEKVQNVTKATANILGMEEPTGVLVVDIISGSPAEKAGLHETEYISRTFGDVILKADNHPITNQENFVNLLRNKESVIIFS